MTSSTSLDAQASADLFRQEPDRYVAVTGGSVALRSVGSGPDLLLIHGWPVSGATFRRLLPHLAAHLTCHIVDLVGAGDSRFDRDTDLDLDLHVHSIRTVLDALGSEDLRVVGFDSGGMCARYAIAGDPRVTQLALINTEQPQGLTRRFEQFVWMSKLPTFARTLAWASGHDRIRRNKFLLGDIFWDRDLLDGEFDEFFLEPLRRDADRRWATGELVKRWDTSLVEGLAELHQRIECPVQLIWGENDPFFPVSWAREMVDTFPDAQLTVVPEAKLFVHEERPAEVAQALLDFFSE